MKFKKITAIFIGLSLIATLFAGCGSKKTEEAASQPEVQSEETQASTSTVSEKKKIKFVCWDIATNAKEFNDLAEEFNKQSNTVEVELVDIASKDYIDKTAVMLTAGEDLDGIAIKEIPQYSSLLMKKQIAPLDEYISKDNFNMNPYGANADVLKAEGKTMALPYRSDFWILYYNKDIFDKAKLAYPTDDMTWEQFREISKKLTSGKGNDKIWGTYFHTFDNTIADISTATRKGDLISGNFGYLKPAFELALEMEQDDKSAMTFAAAKTSNAHYKAMFESGKVAMHVMGTWHIGQLIADKKAGTTNINWGIAKAPHFAENKPGTTVGNLTPVALLSSSKKGDSVWEFLKFMAGEKGAVMLGQRGLMPGYINQAVLDAVASIDGFPKDNKSALETVDVVQQLLPHKNAAQMKKILAEESELILTKAKSIDEGLKELDERTKDLAADNK